MQDYKASYRKEQTKPLSYRQGLVTPIIYAANSLGLLDAYRLLTGSLIQPQAAILRYHRVGEGYPWSLETVAPKDFENQIRYLCQRYKVISLDELGSALSKGKNIPPKAVVITFDDGYKDNYLNAYPILKRYNMPATIFLATGCIDKEELFWWDKVGYAIWHTTLETFRLSELGKYNLKNTRERLRARQSIESQLKELPNNKKNCVVEELVSISGVNIPADLGKELYLAWDDVREMANNGIAFGAHTMYHPILTKLPLEEAKREIVESKKHIEKELRQSITAFAYPNGEPADFNDDIKGILRESGFFYAVTVIPRLNTPRTNLYELGRIPPGWNSYTLKLCLSGLYSDLKNIWSQVKRG